MGKFLPFHQKPNDHGSSRPTATAGKIVKRTSHFLQKKAAKLTQQAYHFQQQHQQSYQPHQHGSYYRQLLSPSVASSSCSSSASTFVAPTTVTPLSENNINEYDRFRQAYETFLVTHDLCQKNWPKSWKDSLRPEHLQDWVCLNSAQLQFQELLYEVVLTENTYVDDLTLAYQIFAKDALSWSELPKSLRLIFDNLVQIIRLHLGLLQELRARQRAQHPIIRTIADLFLDYAPRFLDYYSAYFINFEKANQVVVRAMASKTNPLGVYFRTRSHWPECRNLTLQSFLLKPVQRLMKYPLFFKSLADSLPHLDPDRITHLRTLHELKLVIQRIEVDKKESEEDRKLDDLASRIRGMPINLVIPNRRLVYEGYLTLVPAVQAPLMRSVTKDRLGGQHYTYAPHPNVVARSHSFSSKITPSHSTSSSSNNNNKKRLYVFLFNDMILCTKVRSKTRWVDQDTSYPQNYYGPTPHTLFKLTHPPGQLTFVDRAVSRLVVAKETTTMPPAPPPASSSLLRLGGSLRRSWSTQHHTTIHPMTPLPEYEEHPQQFICSIATRHITNYHFETSTPEEKTQWCEHLEKVLASHVQRPDWLVWGNNSNSTTSAAAAAAAAAASLYSAAAATSVHSLATPLLHDEHTHQDGDQDMDEARSTCWEHKPLPPTTQDDDGDSFCSSSDSSSSNSEEEEEEEKMDMFTTAASSPIHGEFQYQRSSSNSHQHTVEGEESSMIETPTAIMH